MAKLIDCIREFYPQYLGINHYPASQCAHFSKVDEQWGIFGNFAPAPLVVEGREFNCSEKLYQMMKFTTPEALNAIYPLKGQRLKMNARHWVKEGMQRADWGSMFVDAMRFCLVTKYEQCAAFREALTQSEGMFIVEDQSLFRRPADTWGAKLEGDEYVGPNLLGTLLMELRDKGTLEYTLPSDALDFVKMIDK